MWLFEFLFSSILHSWYVEVRISRSILESPMDFEIMSRLHWDGTKFTVVERFNNWNYLSCKSCAVENITRPYQLWRYRHRRKTQSDVTTGVKGRVKVMFVMKDVFSDGIVDESEDYREASKS